MSSSLHSVEKEGPVDKDEQVLARVSSAQETNDVAVATVNA